MKPQISPCQNIIFKKSSKRNQNPSIYYNFVTNLKFQHKPKYQSFKNPNIKTDLLPRGQNPLSYYNESKHNILLAYQLPTKARPTKPFQR